MALFCWFAAGNIEEVYLPVFLKLKGFSLIHLSLFSAVSTFLQCTFAILTGIVTDTTGRPKTILMGYYSIFSLICTCLIFTPNVNECNTKITNFQYIRDRTPYFSTTAPCYAFKNDSSKVNCTIHKFENISLEDDHHEKCAPNKNLVKMIIVEKDKMQNNTDMCQYKVNFKNRLINFSSAYDNNICKSIKMNCTFETQSHCNQNRRVWIVIYGIMVVLLHTSYSISYKLFDIIVVDLTHEHDIDFGRQRVWSILGDLSGPPIAGFLLHAFNTSGRENSYTVAFMTMIFFTFLSALFLWKMDTKMYKPSSEMRKKALILAKNLEMWLFVLLLLIGGSCFGFRAIYGGWYLHGIGATDLLLGVARGMSSAYGLPFLYSSTWWISKVGYRTIFILALLGHVVYCFSFSFLEVPWPAVIIESTCVLTYHLFWVSVMQYVVQIAPEGLQATVRALAGALHFNLS
ncbi:hypothetical protein NPIL_551641 [Nephila pilipes]|uniref:Major facilitator superfamily associated domain-containing protein n=1 Tax=Nephila pilipes TaxID=299642 RepID=A0A8X6QGP8_NEPPI|nr:hypothetical protein NPIL_551641 [Nephila pilipes]